MKAAKTFSLPVELIGKLKDENANYLVAELLASYFKDKETPKDNTLEEIEAIEAEVKEKEFQKKVKDYANENKTEYKEGWLANKWRSSEEFYINKHLEVK